MRSVGEAKQRASKLAQQSQSSFGDGMSFTMTGQPGWSSALILSKWIHMQYNLTFGKTKDKSPDSNTLFHNAEKNTLYTTWSDFS